MFKSIRGTLLFWYASILAAVIGGFGTTLYNNLMHSYRKESDAKLQGHMQLVKAGLTFTSGGDVQLALPEDFRRKTERGDQADVYYRVWNASRTLAATSVPLVDIPYPDPPAAAHRKPDKPWSNERGAFRELVAPGPLGSLILVGQRVEKERERVQQFLVSTIAAGSAAFLLALCGGWALAGRTLAPIRQISDTAAAITGTNLSLRVAESRMKSELSTLAGVLNQTFDRLQAAFERQTQFTADASHELRTPLAVLMSHAELALKKERSADEYRETIETALRASRRMSSVVDGLLTLARSDAQELELNREPLEFATLVDETVALIKPLAEQAGVTIDLKLQPVQILGDASRLRELVTNLVTNAIHYNRAGGTINVRLAADEREAVLTVADTGIGIPAADLPHIFERFYRVDKARARQIGGSGLGLAISKWIVKAHGGAIACTSEENAGTCFTVRLPRESADRVENA